MAVSSSKDLRKNVAYKVIYHDGREDNLGKFKEIKTHMDKHWLTYGSPTRLSDILVFEKYTILEDSAFPINEWDKISSPKLYALPSGGRRRHTSRKHKHATRKHKSKHTRKRSRRSK